MRYRSLFVSCSVFAMAAAGVACQVSVNRGTGNDPNTPANANNTAATTPAATGTTAPTVAPVDTTPGVHAPRGPRTAATGTGTTANPNLSPTTGARLPVMTGGNDFGSGTQTPDSFTGTIYFLPPATQKFPDVSAMQGSGVLYTRNFDIAPRNFDKGFPGVDTRFEWFAIRYTGTLTVAASDITDHRASFSNFGGCVDVYGPGVNIPSDWLNSGTNTISGTSMASPHAAGVGALYKATFGNASSATIVTWIINNSTPNVIIGNPSGTPNRLLYKSTL